MATWNPDEFDPHDPSFLSDPYPTYERFRQNAPVWTVQPYGNPWVFRYEDVQKVLSTDNFVKNPVKPLPGPVKMLSHLPGGFFQSDPPRHTMLRTGIKQVFPGAIDNASSLAEKIAKPIIDQARATGYMELVSDYALPVPAAVLFNILGIPEDTPTDYTRPALMRWMSAIALAHDDTQSLTVRFNGATCEMALNTFYEGFVALCADRPQPGLVGAMCEIIGKPDGFPLAVDVQACATDITIAGYLSTTFLIGTGILNLVDNPAQAKLLRDDPALISGAVHEMLRFDAPAQMVDRIAHVDTELCDVKIPEGTTVTAVIGSANRDPKVFDNPDLFDIQRDDSDSIAFGSGIHYCLGAPLVEKVAPVAVGLLAALDDLQVAGIPQWQTDPYLRAVTSLPIRFAPSR